MLRIISLFLIVLFLSSSFAQNLQADESFRVLENETRFNLAEKQAAVSLAVENPSDEFSARIRLEIRAPNNYVQATQEILQKIGRGKQNLTIPINVSNAALNDNALLWYRLRYEITAENSQSAKISGIISFSQILPEVFELKAITSVPFGEKLFRVLVQAVNPANQNAVADVNIEGVIKIENQEKILKAEVKTDAEGFAVLEFNLPDFETNADVDLKIVGKKNNLTREISDDLEGFAAKLAEIVTDKPIASELGKSLAKIKTNSYGAAKLSLPVQFEAGEDDLDLKFIATDGKGLTGSFEKEIDTDDKSAIQIEPDKAVYRKGEAVKVSITSSAKSGVVFVDILKDYQLLYATQVKLERGRAELVLPYREDFKNSIGIAAYFEESGNDDLIMAMKTIIYPTPTNLEIEAKTPKEIYRPGEQVAVKFRSRNAEKSFTETALGVW